MAEEKTIITLICERAADIDPLMNGGNEITDAPGVKVVKYPCSGMIQPQMIEAAMKAGASGVIVCGCQIGDCYYREGNKMIRDRLLGSRPPGLKKTVDRRRVLALWLARPQKERFLSEAKEFVAYVKGLDGAEGGAAAPAAKPAAKPVEKKAEPAEKAAAAEPAAKDSEAKSAEGGDGGEAKSDESKS